jgi:uncharacterized protein YkwD
MADRVVDSWMNSSRNQEKLLGETWQRHGVGIETTTESGNATLYVTQKLC